MIEIKEKGNERVFEVECTQCKSVLSFCTKDILTKNDDYELFGQVIKKTKDYIICPICRDEVSVEI